MKKQLYLTALLFLIILTTPLPLYGQGGSTDPLPPPSEGCNGVGNPHCPDKVPLTGLEWLAAAGGVYAIKKLKDRNDTSGK